MTEIIKPTSLNSIWAVAGDKVRPDESKIQQGWGVEIPPRQWENWLTNRQDQALAHINQRGVAQWDNLTEYVAGKSYVQGSNGVIYRAKTTHRNIDPTSGTDDWVVAFVGTEDPESFRLFNGYTLISQSFTPAINTRYYALTGLTLTLPASGRAGDGIILNKVANSQVTIVVEGGGFVSTRDGLFEEVVYDIADEINIVWSGSHWTVA